MKSTHLILVAALALSGCSGPKDASIPSDPAAWEKELSPHVKKLSEAEREKLAAYLVRVKLGETFGGAGMPPGTTIGQAIESQTKWQNEQAAKQAEEEALKKKLEQERAAEEKLINEAVVVALLEKRELPSDPRAGRFSRYQEFSIGAQNNSQKVISGVSGTLTFIDVFDKEVGQINFGISERIEPGKSTVWTGGRDYNQFADDQKAVWNLQEGKYKTRFIPEMVVFEDGSKLGATAN